jgi:predicted metal-binding membrane protein
MSEVAQILARPRGLFGAAAALAVTGAAWGALIVGSTMTEKLGVYLGLWTLMMTAMMLPSVLPLVLLYGRSAQWDEQTLLVGAYLAVWSGTGLLAYAADMRLDVPVAPVLLVAAAYELTPLKAACLRGCRAPVDFLVLHWRRGSAGALRIGGKHALYCVGCCWALMAVLVLAASMSLVWAAVLAAVLFTQKVLPGPRWSSIATAIALFVAAILTEVM